MGRSRNRRPPVVPVVESDPHAELRRAAWNYELAERRLVDQARLSESVTDLEQRLIDPGWQRFAVLTAQEFTDAGRQQMRDVCRLMNVASPLIKRAGNLRSAYVHGQGVEITARANGKRDGEQDVQAVVAAFLADRGNKRAYTGAAARDRLEHTLLTDGEFYLTLFTRPTTGEVQVRVVLADEITEHICNPEDRTEPWFYKRRWIETRHKADGTPEQVQQERLYPALDYKPSRRARRFAGLAVAWDAPMLHVAVNRPEHWHHGIPDAYAAINWARAYKTYLEQWAALMSALSRFAWKASAKTPTQAAALRARTSVIPRDPATGEGAVGGTVQVPEGAVLEAIPKSGATIDSESGRPLAMMVAAALDVPVTMLLGDPGLTGSRATAETLDRPTELAMGQRREVWADTDQQILGHVIAAAVKAPSGPLQGRVVRDSWRGTETVELAGDTDPTIEIVWPDLDETTAKEAVDAVVAAAATKVVPPEVVLRLLLNALGVRSAESIIEALVDDEGRFQWPGQPDSRSDTAADKNSPENADQPVGAAEMPDADADNDADAEPDGEAS